MGLTDYTRTSDDPAEDASRYIAGRHLGKAIRNKVFETDISNCFKYLSMRRMTNWACTCSVMKAPHYGTVPMRKHGEHCNVTPEYAYVAKQLGIAPTLAFSKISMSMWYLNWDDWDATKFQVKEMTWDTPT